MDGSRPRFRRSSAALAAFVGFIVLFSAVMSGYAYVDAGREKWGESAWTGSQAGTAITGFLKGADAKAVKSEKNPNPEVMPLTCDLNQRFFSQHPRLFSWLVVLGEVLLPVGILALIVVRFRWSRFLLIGLAALAAFMNFLYLSEGVSSTNPPMAFMWLAIIWLAALWPAAAFFYAVDLGAPTGRPSAPTTDAAEPPVGQWFFFLAILAVIVAGSLAIYWDKLAAFAVLTVASLALTAALALIKVRVVRAPRRGARSAMKVDSGRV